MCSAESGAALPCEAKRDVELIFFGAVAAVSSKKLSCFYTCLCSVTLAPTRAWGRGTRRAYPEEDYEGQVSSSSVLSGVPLVRPLVVKVGGEPSGGDSLLSPYKPL